MKSTPSADRNCKIIIYQSILLKLDPDFSALYVEDSSINMLTEDVRKASLRSNLHVNFTTFQTLKNKQSVI